MQNSDRLGARLRSARNFRPGNFVRFDCGTEAIGWIRRSLAGRLTSWPEIFESSAASIQLRPAAEAVLSARLAAVATALARDGMIRGWRGETYAVRAKEGGTPLFHLERAAMRFFGLTSSAAHLNGFFFKGENPSIWIARRAATKSIDPGMFDKLVAGGVTSGQDAWQTLLRESGEEAGIAPVLAAKARPAGVLRACREVPEGLESEVLYVFDLALPAEFAPRNTDGEVSEFLPLHARALLDRIARGEMTIEAGLVAVDFVLRHELVADSDGTLRTAVEACRPDVARGAGSVG